MKTNRLYPNKDQTKSDPCKTFTSETKKSNLMKNLRKKVFLFRITAASGGWGWNV